MKKKIIIGVIVLVLFLGTITYLITKPINNDYIEYTSADEYKTELIKAIESEDYKLASNLVYSIANSEYYEELDKEVVDFKYNNEESSSTSETLYNGLIGSLDYIDINEDSDFEIKQVDINNLNDNGAVYFEYTIDGVAGYYVNYYNSGSLVRFDSINECVEKGNEKDYCNDYLYLDISYEMPYPEIIPLTDINYTIFNSDYKNSEQETVIDYSSNREFDTFIDVVYDLDKIMDEDTSQEERDELQLEIVDLAHEQGYFVYGVSAGQYRYSLDESGVLADVQATYIEANKDNDIDQFINSDYYDTDEFNMYKFAQDYSENNYLDMIYFINTDITFYETY